MAQLSPQTVQFISQLGLLTLVDPSTGPKGPLGTTAYILVPTSCWNSGTPFPRDVRDELKGANLDTFVNEGVEYFKVPDQTSTNLPGKLSHYAQTTSVDDMLNPPGGGWNRVAETFVGKNAASHVVDADAVSKYIKSNDIDTFDQAEDQQAELDARIKRQISDDVPTEQNSYADNIQSTVENSTPTE